MTRFKRALTFAGFALLISYFGYHTFTGTSGVRHLAAYHQREAALNRELARLQECRADLQKRIRMLSDESLDLDYLDERARAVLFYAKPEDKVLSLGQESPGAALQSHACDGVMS